MQVDPIGYSGGINLYHYVRNDPLNLIDPSGLVVDNVSSAASALVTCASPCLASDAEGSRASLRTALDLCAAACDPAVHISVMDPFGATVLEGLSLLAGTVRVAEGGLIAAETPTLFKNLAPLDEINAPNLFPASQVQAVGYNGRLNYIVTDSGDLVLGKSGHIDLSGGADVSAAGEARFVGGEVRSINNLSGHYQPSGAAAQSAAEGAFNQAGFDATGKYIEKRF